MSILHGQTSTVGKSIPYESSSVIQVFTIFDELYVHFNLSFKVLVEFKFNEGTDLSVILKKK